MSAPQPDMPSSDPQPEPAPGGGRLGEWLRGLLQVGLVLVMEMRFFADPRSQEGDAGAADRVCASHSLAWDLVARAIRWTRALQARLAAEARAERTGISPETERLERAERLFERPEWYEPSKTRVRAEDPSIRPRADDCIAGMATAEVVGHICADLTAAATLLAKSKALRIVVSIAEAARAILGGLDDWWQARPLGPVPDGAAGAAIHRAAVMGLRAPDTG